MDVNILREIVTVASLGAFVGIWVWAWAWQPRKRKDFDEAARLAVDEVDGEPRA